MGGTSTLIMNVFYIMAYTWIAVTDYIDNHLGSPDQKYQQWKEKTAGGAVCIPLRSGCVGIIEKSPDIRYLTHMIVFPDGDAFVEQKPFVHDLMFELKNWQHLPPFNGPSVNFSECSKRLLSKGEYKFETPTDKFGTITHVMRIEDEQRPCGFFGKRKINLVR